MTRGRSPFPPYLVPSPLLLSLSLSLFDFVPTAVATAVTSGRNLHFRIYLYVIFKKDLEGSSSSLLFSPLLVKNTSLGGVRERTSVMLNAR